MKNKRILVTGATGFLGAHFVAALNRQGYKKIIPLSKKDYDLMEQEQVRKMFKEKKPEIVVHLAGYVGGILVNKSYPADFYYKNLSMESTIIHEASKNKIEKLMLCICGCAYPEKAKSPIKEESLWEGFPSNEPAPYGIAKRGSVMQSLAYRKQYGLKTIILVPGNMYGPYDNYNLEAAHVIPALIRKFHEATIKNKKEVVVWGSGKPTRDFVYVEDVAGCLVHALENYDDEGIINISTGTENSIKDLIEIIAKITKYKGKIVWDKSKPDGPLKKIFDVERMRKTLGYECTTSLEQGLKKTAEWFEHNYPDGVRL